MPSRLAWVLFAGVGFGCRIESEELKVVESGGIP